MVHVSYEMGIAILIFKKIKKEYYIIVPLYKRKFCDGHIMLVSIIITVILVVLLCLVNQYKPVDELKAIYKRF